MAQLALQHIKPGSQARIVGSPFKFGHHTANQAGIEALVTYALQQELIPSRPRLNDVFVVIDP